MNPPTISRFVDQFARPITAYSDVFEGARQTRHRGWVARADKDTSQLLNQWTRRQMMSIARVLFENVGFAKGATRDIARYSVGAGLIAQSQIPDLSVRAAYEDYWREWSKIPEVTNQHDYCDVCYLRSIAIDVDGEIGQAYTETDTGFPKIQLVESHRIESDPGDGSWTDGVRTDSNGAPRAYSIRVGDSEYRKIDADNFHLAIDRDRCDALRGKTAFHAALNTIRDVYEILGAEKVGVKVNSALALIMKVSAAEANAGGTMFGPQGTLSSASGDLKLDRLFSGAIPRLNVGEDIVSHASDRPSPTFTGFLDFLLRDVANGLGVPWEFVWDASKLGGSTNRLAIAKAQRKFDERTRLLCKVARRDWGYVVSKGAKRGDLPYDENWWRVTWQTPRKITVDEGRDADQNRQDIFAGLRTVSEDYAERGLDYEEAGDQQERELDAMLVRAGRLAKAHSITVEKAMELLQQRSPNPAAPAMPTAAKPILK